MEEINDQPRSARQADSTKNEDNLPWIEKYRPITLEDVLSQKEITNTLNKLIETNRFPHLLFYGPPGTGKTSTILACARKLYGKNYSSMVLELNASDERGIDVVRDQIKTFAATQKLFSSGLKLVILDESDNMTNTAQFALRRVIEQYSKTTRFCLICNYVSKIISALQSRCTKFRFMPLDESLIVDQVAKIAENENLNIDSDGLKLVVDLGEGDMRKVLNILQSTSMSCSIINYDNICRCVGILSMEIIDQIFTLLMNDTFEVIYTKISEIKKHHSIALADIIKHIPRLLLENSLPNDVICYMISELSDLEHRLSVSTTESIQVASLVGIFVKGREKLSKYV